MAENRRGRRKALRALLIRVSFQIHVEHLVGTAASSSAGGPKNDRTPRISKRRRQSIVSAGLNPELRESMVAETSTTQPTVIGTNISRSVVDARRSI